VDQRLHTIIVLLKSKLRAGRTQGGTEAHHIIQPARIKSRMKNSQEAHHPDYSRTGDKCQETIGGGLLLLPPPASKVRHLRIKKFQEY
jgi:hypothetical protein